MKRLLTLLLLTALLSAVTDSKAQRRGKSHASSFDYEIRGGINFSQIDGDGSGNYNKIGFHVGAGTSMPLSGDARWRLCVEVGLSQKGAHIVNDVFNRRISLLYVEVPLMLAYDFLDSRNLRVSAGLSPAILAAARVTDDKALNNSHSNNYKLIDALPLTAGVRYRITDHIGVDLRYCNSMLNIAKENGSGTYRISRANKGQFNRLIQAGITISFN